MSCKKNANQNSTALTVINSTVSTFVGSGAVGSIDGTGKHASFNNPYSLTIDGTGNIYVTDYGNNRIRKITSQGVVSTITEVTQPTGIVVDQSSTLYITTPRSLYKISTLGWPVYVPSNLSFTQLWGIASGANGYLYLTDSETQQVYKINNTGLTTVLAGSGLVGADNKTGLAATFNEPHGICVDASGNCYVIDVLNSQIRKITPDGVVTTFETGINCQGICIDPTGNIFTASNPIYKISPNGTKSIVAGNGNTGYTDGSGTTATFNQPYGIALDANGNIYVADTFNNVIRKIVIN